MSTNWDEYKNEKEGYLRVRKAEDRALLGNAKKHNDDPEATGYIELKTDDLGGIGGGGGPHTHSEYAPKTHTHDEYLTDLPDHDHPHTHPEYEGTGDSYDDTEIKKRLDDTESNTTKNRQKIDNIQNSINDINNNKLPAKADVDHTHDSGGGGESYDDSWIQPALDSKSDATHTHDAADPTHNHDGEYSNAVHGHDEFMVLQNQINGKADEDHTHDAPDLTHEHEGMVASASVTSIVRLSQAEFDALADKDSSTLYLVV